MDKNKENSTTKALNIIKNNNGIIRTKTAIFVRGN